MMLGTAIINASAFTGSTYLAKYISGDDTAEERKRHDLETEKYQRDLDAWTKQQQQYQSWLEKNYKDKMQADKTFENTDYAFKLYAQTHHAPMIRKPVMPKRHKNNELLYMGIGGLVIGAIATYI